jgi:hypothetical protein
MTRITRSRALAAAVALAATTGGLAALAAATTGSATARPAPSHVVPNFGFELDQSLAEMVRLPSNEDIVAGHVTAVRQARWNTQDGYAPQPGAAGPYYVYTPVEVTLDGILRGTDYVAGRTITVRRYDGTVGDTTYVSEDGRPSCALQQGQRVVLFVQSPHPLNDGRNDVIANAAYSIGAGPDGVLTAGDGTVYGTLAQLGALLGDPVEALGLAPNGGTPGGCGTQQS